jgi:hypothetical protein
LPKPGRRNRILTPKGNVQRITNAKYRKLPSSALSAGRRFAAILADGFFELSLWVARVVLLQLFEFQIVHLEGFLDAMLVHLEDGLAPGNNILSEIAWKIRKDTMLQPEPFLKIAYCKSRYYIILWAFFFKSHIVTQDTMLYPVHL